MISKEVLQERIHEALRQWHDPMSETPLDGLYIVRIHASAGRSAHQIANQLLMGLLDRLGKTQPDLAHLLRLRFLDNMKTHHAANRLNISDATLYRRQSEAIARLADLLAAEEADALAERARQLEERLELASYDRLFGVDVHLK